MTLIAAIDPGETTGVCIIETAKNDFQVAYVDQIPWTDRLPFFRALFSGKFLIHEEPRLPEVVIIETFLLRPGRAMEQVGSDFPSVRIIGIVEAFMSLCNPVPSLVYQHPSVMSRVMVLNRHKPFFIGFIHASDAYKHARYYFVTHASTFTS